MEEKEILNLILEKSRNCGIEFPNLLMFYIRFHLYRALSKNESGVTCCFKDEPVLREGIYLPEKDQKIAIYISEDSDGLDVLEGLSQRLFEKGITLVREQKDSIRKSEFFELRMTLELALGRFRCEYVVEFKKADNNRIYPIRKELQDILDEKDKFEILMLPSENQAVEYLVDIMKKLELINDMDIYLKLFSILETDTLDGRKLVTVLENRLEADSVQPTEKKLEKLCSYSSYKYMINKWNRFLKVNKLTEPDWETVHGKILVFLEPLWNAVSKEQVFIDTWMPELGRYLG